MEFLASLLSSALPAAAETAVTTLPEAAASTLPEAITETAASSLPEAAASTLPEASTGIMQGADIPNILQGKAMASPEAIQSAGLTADVPDAVSTITAETPGVSPFTPGGTDLSNLSPEGANEVASNQAATPNLRAFSPPSQVAAPAADVADKGIGSFFNEGWKSASDLFSGVEDKLGKGADWVEAHPKTSMAAGILGAKVLDAAFRPKLPTPEKYTGPLSKYHLAPNYMPAVATPTYYTPTYAAQGGIMSLAMGGPATTPQPGQMYPQSQQEHTQFATPTQMPTSAEVINSGYEPQTNPYTGDMPLRMASGGETENPLLALYKESIKSPKVIEPTALDSGIHEDTDPDTKYQDALTAAITRDKKLAMLYRPTPFKAQPISPQLAQAQQQAVQAASGGIMGYSLGGYAAGGRQSRLLKGPGDGMSDNIPATIADRQPARLADGEFVVPADVVSHLGNGSTDAGAKKLHGMMDKVRVARTGKKKQGTEINPDKYLPA